MADVQTILKDVQAFAPLIETALGLSDGVKSKINALMSIGAGVDNFLTTLQGQVNTVSSGGSVDFAALNATLNNLHAQAESVIDSASQA